MRGNISGVIALVAVFSLSALGQLPQSQTTNIPMKNAPAARLPYTAEYKITSVKTLSDGSTMTHESNETVAVDSQGRWMTATTNIPLFEGQTRTTHVMVIDPVALTESSWSVPGRKPFVMKMKPIDAHSLEHSPDVSSTDCREPPPICLQASSPCISTMVSKTYASGVPHEKPRVENLGTETFLGIEANGHRTTTTIPVGAIGNNEPLMRVIELWTATDPGLHCLAVREKSDDLRIGVMTRELVNFNQSEPDASIFQPPTEYETEEPKMAGHSSSSATSGETPPPPEQ
jgi:hypothetical protein